LSDTELPLGIFGENFTLAGFREENVNIGDRFRIGDVHLMVTQPCLPCYKPGIRFGPDMVKQFLESHRTGFYFRVLQEGEVGAGDTKRVGEPGQQQYHCCRSHSTLCW